MSLIRIKPGRGSFFYGESFPDGGRTEMEREATSPIDEAASLRHPRAPAVAGLFFVVLSVGVFVVGVVLVGVDIHFVVGIALIDRIID